MAQERRDNSRMNEFLFDSGPSIFGRITMRERRYHPDNETQHTPTNSFASDMQVEVSESSSPPLTVDGEEESSINDRDMDKKINSRIDETWGESNHLAEVDKNESSSREVHEVSELDLIQVGFSRIKHKSAPVSLHLSPVKEAERDHVNPFSVSHSKIELMEKLFARPSNNGDSEKAKVCQFLLYYIYHINKYIMTGPISTAAFEALSCLYLPLLQYYALHHSFLFPILPM